jgi:hypothetical protein
VPPRTPAIRVVVQRRLKQYPFRNVDPIAEPLRNVGFQTFRTSSRDSAFTYIAMRNVRNVYEKALGIPRAHARVRARVCIEVPQNVPHVPHSRRNLLMEMYLKVRNVGFQTFRNVPRNGPNVPQNS